MKYWGDIHSHNNVGYGKGSAERALSIASASLDFCAITPHAWWPDLPDNDIRLKHVRGFRRTADRWARTLRLVNDQNTPGEFVTFPAYEWHSLEWGDFCIHFPGGYPQIARVDTVDELIEHARANDALVVPHHCAYPAGRRGTNWEAIAEYGLPLAEVFSEHGSSLDSPSPFPMYRHSMGGSKRSQTVLRQLQRGRRMSFLAGTDNHYGHPGAYGEGLTAVYASRLDRESIFEGLRNGHTYAVTGDRIDVDFGVDNNGSLAIPGARLVTDGTLAGVLQVTARAAIERVEVLKNGTDRLPLRQTDREDWQPGAPRGVFVRFEWGWDGLDSNEITEWEIDFELCDGEIRGIEPCFCTGPDTSEFTPTVTRSGVGEVHVVSHSARTNPRPVQGIVFECSVDLTAEWNLSLSIIRGGERVETRRSVSMSSLGDDDMHFDLSDRFSFPRMKVHTVPSQTEIRFAGEWKDHKAKPGDFYFARIIQKNGHRAWTSPVWCK